MLMEWLEPTIEKRTIELFDSIVDNEVNELYVKFMSMVKSTGAPKSVVFDIENHFILTVRRAVEVSYKAGIGEGIELKR